MTAGESRDLTNHLVAAENDEAAKNNKLRVSCFVHTGGLIHWAKHEADKLINPQCLTLHVTSPETHEQVAPVDHASRKVSLFAAPEDIMFPENDIGNSDTCEQPDCIDEEIDLVTEEDCVTELQLKSPEVLEDSRAVESEEEHPFA